MQDVALDVNYNVRKALQCQCVQDVASDINDNVCNLVSYLVL